MPYVKGVQLLDLSKATGNQRPTQHILLNASRANLVSVFFLLITIAKEIVDRAIKVFSVLIARKDTTKTLAPSAKNALIMQSHLSKLF